MMPSPTSPVRDAASIERLSRTFASGLSIVDLARPLISLDDNQTAAAGLDLLHRSGETVLGLRSDGLIVAWATAEDLASGGLLVDHSRPFDSHLMLNDAAGIREVLVAIGNAPHIFVRWLGIVTGVVTKVDLQKPPVRMWLFGLVTLLDTNLTWALETVYPGEAWTGLISKGRLEKAIALRDERRRRGSDCRLVDCLQIKDKADALTRDAARFQQLGWMSRRETERLAGDIEVLRNHLAHAQELEDAHLATAARLAALLEAILRADIASRLVATVELSSPSPNPLPPSSNPSAPASSSSLES